MVTKATLPTREEILRFVAETSGRVGKREIARAFGVKGDDRVDLKALLSEMTEEGLIAKAGKRLRQPGELPRVTLLSVTMRTEDGDLIGEPTSWEDDGPRPKVLILEGDARAAPAVGDRLLARISYHSERQITGRVIKVLERRAASTLAVLERIAGRPQLSPVTKKERDIYQIDADAVRDLADNTLVRIEAVRGRSARVVEVIGPVDAEATVSLLAIHNHNIPNRFPERVLDEAAAAPAAPLSGREDWRDVPFITIDPADAKDHDDAVFAEPDANNPGGHVVSVAIADVAHYVRTGTVMDTEARLRGNSTYFPDRVVPMLPERISNDLCSLREGEARLALVMRMVFASDGRKTRHTLHRVLMRSARKLAYSEAQAIADAEGSDVKGLVDALYDAYEAVDRARAARQPMALDLPERRILLGADGGVDEVVTPQRLKAHKLIEEFMIAANVAAAESAEAASIPLLYRVHDAPSADRLDALREFLATLDIKLAKGTRLRPEHFNAILAHVEGSPNAALVNEVVLRAQAQAEYAPDNLGHFGLNLRRYAHFTSPIRRYADLIVHRALIRAHNLGPDGLRDEEIDGLTQIGAEISATERRSMAAERETIDRLIAGWLAGSVGATFEGKIAGVTKAGLFVKLAHSGGDGFVPISSLRQEYMIYDETARALIGEASGHTYRLGDLVVARLVEAAPFSGALRFEITEHTGGAKLRPSRRPMARRHSYPKRGRR